MTTWRCNNHGLAGDESLIALTIYVLSLGLSDLYRTYAPLMDPSRSGHASRSARIGSHTITFEFHD